MAKARHTSKTEEVEFSSSSSSSSEDLSDSDSDWFPEDGDEEEYDHSREYNRYD